MDNFQEKPAESTVDSELQKPKDDLKTKEQPESNDDLKIKDIYSRLIIEIIDGLKNNPKKNERDDQILLWAMRMKILLGQWIQIWEIKKDQLVNFFLTSDLWNTFNAKVADLKIKEEQMDVKIDFQKKYFEQKNWKEGVDYQIVSYKEIEKMIDPNKKMPIDSSQFFICINENKNEEYKRDMIQYVDSLNNGKNNSWEKTTLWYSWQWRIFIWSWRTHFETVSMTDIKTHSFDTHHGEFKEFFKKRTWLDFPWADKVNDTIFKIYNNKEEWLQKYDENINELEKKMALLDSKSDSAYKFANYIKWMKFYRIVINRIWKDPSMQVKDLPEHCDDNNKMVEEMARCNDLTYNSHTNIDIWDVIKETGIQIKDEYRLDKIFWWNFQISDMAKVVKDFSDEISFKKK